MGLGLEIEPHLVHPNSVTGIVSFRINPPCNCGGVVVSELRAINTPNNAGTRWLYVCNVCNNLRLNLAYPACME